MIFLYVENYFTSFYSKDENPLGGFGGFMLTHIFSLTKIDTKFQETNKQTP